MWGIERHSHEHGDHEHDDHCNHHDHSMVFHSCVCTEILFNGWRTTNAAQLFGSSLAIFLAAVLYEGLKSYRQELAHRQPSPAGAGSQADIVKNEGATHNPSNRQGLLSGSHAVQTLLHFLQTTVSYMLMLIFMTYNVWLCLALVLGLTVGYFLFAWRRPNLNDCNETCH